MTASHVIKKIIWAVDAVQESSALQEHTLEALRYLVTTTHASVEPVYVFSPAQLDMSVEFTGPWSGQFRPTAERVIRDLVAQAHVPGVEDPKVVIQYLPSVRNAVNALESYARLREADVILLNTHARKGVARLLLGSFAETLLLRSRVPVLIVGPGSRAIHGFNEILFPSDFGDHSKTMFRYVVSLAGEFQSRIVLFHAIPGGLWIPPPHVYLQLVERRRKHADKWARWAATQGVPVEITIEEDVGNISETIMETAQVRQIDLIAMAAQSGPIASTMIGSITRQVVREACCPVWVLRRLPHVKTTAKKKAA